MVKKVLTVAILILFVLIAPGCTFPQHFPIEDTQNILIAGFDVEGEEIILTVLVDSIAQQGGSGQEKIENRLYCARGKTILEAKRNLHTFAEKRVTFYHTVYIVVGQDAAKNSIDKIINFFSEDDETNFLHILIIAKGMTAKEYLEQQNTEEKKVPDILSTLFNETSHTGYSKEINLIDYSIMRDTPWKNPYIPTVVLRKDMIVRVDDEDKESEQNDNSQPPKTLTYLEGFGIFDDEDKLIGYLDAYMARGMLFMTGDVKGTPLSVKDNEGNYVALEVMETKAQIKPKYGDPLSATIEISVRTNLDEYQEADEALEEDYINHLEQKQNEFIKNEVEGALRYLQDKQTDTIGMGDAFYHEHPIKWQDIKGDWQSIFAELDIEIKVTSHIQFTYVLTDAVGK